MKNVQTQIKNEGQLAKALQDLAAIEPNFMVIFGSDACFNENGWVAKVTKAFPKAQIIGCSTAGEISNQGVSDDTLVITASHFETSSFAPVSAIVPTMFETRKAGVSLGNDLKKEGLRGIFVLGKGLNVNGSALIDGLREAVGQEVVITGGLAGDGGKFQRTFTVLNGAIHDDRVVALGLYGEDMQIAYGSMGGWQAFGPVRRITKSKENVLFELDGKPALQIYKTYLGDKVSGLPASGLLFPFALLKDNQDTTGVIRTILGVNEEDQSVTLAGDMPQNGIVRLMHTNNEGLVAGARGAAEAAVNSFDLKEGDAGISILISCVGRKLVMGDDVEDELDAVNEVFGKGMVTGFYSYGEICATAGFSECKLHNQTMTITHISEKKKAA
ncbi:MAG: hypothetical protein EOP11_03155 [Proteobacteria bacterium]|nr:MAG: hypothetical protein EOP11_03155 [Pseudomonadota bacterium]